MVWGPQAWLAEHIYLKNLRNLCRNEWETIVWSCAATTAQKICKVVAVPTILNTAIRANKELPYMIYALSFQWSFTSSSNMLIHFFQWQPWLWLPLWSLQQNLAKGWIWDSLRMTSLSTGMALPSTSKNSWAIWMGSKTYLYAYIPSTIQGE